MSTTSYFESTIARLHDAVVTQNLPGSLQGLLAQHILATDRLARVPWRVLCTDEWLGHEYNPTNAEMVAALGLSIAAARDQRHEDKLRTGLERVVARDPFSGEHLSLARGPARLLGIALGAICINHDPTRSWLLTLLDGIGREPDTYRDPLYAYLRFLLHSAPVTLSLRADATMYEQCFADWMLRRSIATVAGPPDMDELLFATTTRLEFESAFQAALIWTTMNAHLFVALNGTRQQPRHVVGILEQFEAAMKRWRWDPQDSTKQKIIQWPITEEREVQDILYLILRSYFPDLTDEEGLPKFGHSSYRVDFAIPSLGVLIEAKYATDSTEFKRIEKDVLEDAVPYLQQAKYQHIIVFIYDASASVQEHSITKDALRRIPGVYDVAIVSKPSQLPLPTSQRQRKGKAK